MHKGRLQVGKMTLEVEGNMQDIFKFATTFGSLPGECHACGSKNLGLNYRKAQEKYDYFGLKCYDCTAEATFGISNDESKSLFWRTDNKMEVYKKEKF